MTLPLEVTEKLEKPFDPTEIKSRKGRGGSKLDYVETHAVIQRLNDAFEGGWSFEVINHSMTGSHIVVLGALSFDGIRKMQFGSKEVAVYDQKHDKAGEIIDLGDDFKAATSDCLKKCATLFGVGLSLYSDSLPSESETGSGKGGKKKPDAANGSSLGEIKNLVMEKEREVEEMTGIQRNDLRREKLGNTSLDHPVETLRSYYANLQKALKAHESKGE